MRPVIRVTRGRRQAHLSPIFGVKEQSCLIDYTRINEALELQFPKLQIVSESVETLSRNRDPNLTKTEHVYAICCRPEAAGDAITGGNLKTIEGYVVLNFETVSISSFRGNQNESFM